MQDLLDKLQESPPQSEEELRGILDETGYDLIMKEPSPEEEEMPDDEGPDDEGIAAEEEVEEELPPDDMGEGSETADMLESMLPPGMDSGSPGVHPRMKMKIMTFKAANSAMKKDKKGRKS
tara:strand:+ start:221 stop:583 length:363 start_codon:yes stop_codon:yes gene_type:complete